MTAAVPFVEVAYDTDSPGIGRPDDKMDSGDTLDVSHMSDHCVIGLEECALGEEMQFKVGEKRWERIGIMPFRDLSRVVCHAEPIGTGPKRLRNNRFEQPCLMHEHHRNGLLVSFTQE